MKCGATAAQEVEGSSTYQKVGGSIFGLGSLRVEVSLHKILNPKLLQTLCISVSMCNVCNEQVA